MKLTKKSQRRLLLIPAAIALLGLGLASTRLDIAVRRFTEKSAKVSSPVRLLVIADLHSAWYGDKQEVLLEQISAQEPDLLVLVGDIVDDKLPRDGAEALLESIGEQYPCYYVSGNHEFWSGEAEEIKSFIRSCNIQVLEGDTRILELGTQGQKLCLSGVDDPDRETDDTFWREQLESCVEARDDALYTILLTHRPERVDSYRASGFDLVLCGHAHGGQVRIPGLVNGLFAPDQGLFPAYAGGRYDLEDTVMIVSRGLSKKHLPRVCNRPELVVVDIVPSAE